MVILIVVMHVFVCVFLIAVILFQAGRGQGLSWGVFGGTPQSILGTKTASFLKRVTTGCAIVFLFTVIILNIIETRKSKSLLLPQGAANSQIDFSKIKKALEEAEKAKAEGKTATQTQATAVSGAASNAAAETKTAVTETAAQAPQATATVPTNPVPPPPDKH